MAKLVYKHFTADSSWTVPAGITRVFLLGHGGGGGGSGGINATTSRAYPGIATTPYLMSVTVVPNTTYTITMGTGGSGGIARTSTTQNGGTGTSTTFGALATFSGASVTTYLSNTAGQSGAKPGWIAPSHGGYNTTGIQAATSGFINQTMNFATSSGSYSGGWDGIPGYVGSTTGSGGAANSVGTGSNATSGTGYGYGGAGGGAGSTAGGTGSAGGPGQLWVIWVE
jgi:hypothetical protein